MEILRVLSGEWERRSSLSFAFRKPETLDRFFNFVTDARNARTVFSNGLYRIHAVTSNGNEITDPDYLRERGRVFNCAGKLMLKGFALPLTADFIITNYLPGQEVQVAVRDEGFAVNRLRMSLQAGWHVEKDQLEALFNIRLKMSGVTLPLLPLLPSPRELDESIGELGLKIKEAFLRTEKRGMD